MAPNREPARRSRFDVPISSGKRSRPQRYGNRDRFSGAGTSKALVDAGIVVVTTVATTLLLLAISGQIFDSTASNLIAASAPLAPERIITVQATPQPSLPGQTPIAQPTRSAATLTPEDATVAAATTPDDTTIQAGVDKQLEAEGSLSAQGITATVVNGKVTLVGTAPSDELKAAIEKLVRAIKGVKQVDNQIVVISNM